MKKMKKAVVVLLTMILFLQNVEVVQAASKYITVNTFAKELLKGMGLPAESNKKNIEKLTELGIIEEGDFKDYAASLTRGDALMLVSRADDYMNSPELKEAMVKRVMDRRISDIKKAKASKREDIARGFMKGFLKGYSNGLYRTNREIRMDQKITRAGALSMIQMIQSSSKRAKLSPDGLLIRTTKLPKNADKFDYILECYPNRFYERQFEFTLYDDYLKYDDWAYPVDMKNQTFKNWYSQWPLIEEMDKYLYDWADLAEKYLTYLFNVDYRTVDDAWINGLGGVYTRSNIDKPVHIHKYYIPGIKNNQVIVESQIIAVEPSIFYEDDDYCIRAYVKYRITAKNINVEHGTLIYSMGYPLLKNLKSGEWREGIFDIRFNPNNGSSGDGSSFAIDTLVRLVDLHD